MAFGHRMVRWVDQRFAHRLAGGPPPLKPPKGGPERVRHEWREFGRAVLAAWFPRLGVVLAFWFVFGPLLYTIRPGAPQHPEP